MRFLCLHGMGTNSSIFEAQLAPIVANLDPSHEFVYVNGEIECEPAEGVATIFSGPFYCYYGQPTPDQLQAAFDLVHDVMEEEGPFDGIIGFSQGAALAASLLLNYRKKNPRGGCDLFRAAIFTCGSLPFDPDAVDEAPGFRAVVCPETGLVRLHEVVLSDSESDDDNNRLELVERSGTCGYVSIPRPTLLDENTAHVQAPFLRRHHAERTKVRISIPTLHVVGETDPYLPQGRALVDLCAGDKTVISHGLGHSLPRDTMFARKTAQAMEAMISKAIFQC